VTGQLSQAGPYDLLDVLHRGSRATVYLATKRDHNQEIVLKVLDDASRKGDWPTREIAAAARLSHRHIVRTLDVGADGDITYIAFERLRGRTLKQLMEDGAFTPDVHRRVDLVAQLCIGLHHAHEQLVVHGSITPDNVFVTDDGTVKILNFGAAPTVDRTVVSENALAGSFEYMAPEQIIGRDTLDGRSDVFSAAVVLYELVSGKRPFQAGSTPATLARILREDPAPLDALPRLNAVIKRALEKEPSRRFATAQELAYALWILEVPDAPGEDDSQAVPIVRKPKSAEADTETAEQPAIAMPPVPPPPPPKPSVITDLVRRFWPRK
jgi:serine/threonine protein kinase